MANNQKAPSDAHIVKTNRAYRDVRRVHRMILDDMGSWDMAIAFVIALPIPAFYSAAFSFITIPATLLAITMAAYSKKNRTLPMKLPVFLKGYTDYNDFKPGNRKKYNKAGGTIMLANMQRGGAEVWVKGKDLLTHMLVIGTTGGGKTEMLVSLAGSSAFCMGGGLIYVDAKAAPKLLYQFVTLARIFGREDDFRVINYQTGNKVVAERHWERLSNTTNPFAQGTASTAVQTLTGLLPSGGGDNQYFLDRAIAILRTLMPALVELRDQGIINIYPSLIGECISVEKFMALGRNEIEFNGIKYEHVKLSERSTKVINTFLKQLPNYNPKLDASQQHEEVSRQFGFAEGYFARTLANLAGTYGHIYETELAESDFVDIVLHNRILVVMVPAAESAPEERAALGKVVLSSIRVAMAQGLGNKGEGDRQDAVDSLPVDLRIPSVVVVDEYAEVAVDGFAVTATQGRGLGMAVVFAGQDLAGFERANEKEAEMIFSNTRLKLLLALQDAQSTWRKFKDLAGTVKVAAASGWERQDMGLDTYERQKTVSIQEVDRINIDDLKSQIEGEGHLFESDNIHRVKTFHHGIGDEDLIVNFRINRMLKIKVPSPDAIEQLRRSEERIRRIEALSQVSTIIPQQPPRLVKELSQHVSHGRSNWVESLLDEMLPETSLTTADDSALDMNTVQTQIDAADSHDGSGLEGLDLAELGLEDDEQQPKESEPERNLANDSHDLVGSPVANKPDIPQSKSIPNTGATTVANPTSVAQKESRQQAGLTAALSDKKHQWIFGIVEPRDPKSGKPAINQALEDIAELNEAAGIEGGEAMAMAIRTVEDVSDTITYPSQEIQALETDPHDLWKALSKGD